MLNILVNNMISKTLFQGEKITTEFYRYEKIFII